MKIPPSLPAGRSLLNTFILDGKISEDKIESSNHDSVPTTMSALVESIKCSNSTALLQMDLQLILSTVSFLAGFDSFLLDLFLIGDEAAIEEVKELFMFMSLSARTEKRLSDSNEDTLKKELKILLGKFGISH